MRELESHLQLIIIDSLIITKVSKVTQTQTHIMYHQQVFPGTFLLSFCK